MKKLFIMIVLVLMSLVLIAEGQTVEEKQYMGIATSDPAASYYPVGAGISSVLTKYVPGMSNVTVETTGSAIENGRLVGSGSDEIGFSTSFSSYRSYNGIGTEPQPNIRLWFSYAPTAFHIVVGKNSTIKSLNDLKGKKVSVGPPGSGTALEAEDLFTEFGLKSGDKLEITIQNLTFSEAGNALRDGNIDAFFAEQGMPSAVIIDLAVSGKIRLLSVPDNIINSIVEKKTYYKPVIITAEMYEGLDQQTNTIGAINLTIINSELSDDLVYEMTKAVFEHADEIAEKHPSAKYINIENAVAVKSIPYHPGAIRYYKEVGVWKD